MTEAIPATPGWAEARLEQIFARLPPDAAPACNAFAVCLARSKAPATPSDLLGAEFEPCHAALRRDLAQAGLDPALLDALGRDLAALEAELAAES